MYFSSIQYCNVPCFLDYKQALIVMRFDGTTVLSYVIINLFNYYIGLIILFINIYQVSVSRAWCNSVALTSSMYRSPPSYVVTTMDFTITMIESFQGPGRVTKR